MSDRVLGAVLGLAVGDAMGASQEFSDPEGVPDFPDLATGPQTEVIGGGPFAVVPGAVTDDTHMAVCLSSSLIANKGWAPEDVENRYRAWVKGAFDCGRLTKDSLLHGGGLAVWERTGRNSAGNGSLMRTAPIGAFYTSDISEVIRVSLADSALTHFDPRCQLACAAFNVAIAHAISDDNVTSMSMVLAADQALEVAASVLAKEYPKYGALIDDAVECLRTDLQMAVMTDPILYDYIAATSGDLEEMTEEDLKILSATGGLSIVGSGMGFVRVAFRLAFWELLHAPTFEAALIDVVNRGGDSDTNAAITGALLGAFYGSEAIPPQWVDTVLTALPGGAEHPYSTVYHPRNLLSLALWRKK